MRDTIGEGLSRQTKFNAFNLVFPHNKVKFVQKTNGGNFSESHGCIILHFNIMNVSLSNKYKFAFVCPEQYPTEENNLINRIMILVLTTTKRLSCNF